MEAQREEELEGYRRAAYTAWINLSAQAEKNSKFPSFPKFLEQLGLGHELEASESEEDAHSRAAGGGARGTSGMDPRSKDEIMEAAQKVADLDQRRLTKLRLLETPDENGS